MFVSTLRASLLDVAKNFILVLCDVVELVENIFAEILWEPFKYLIPSLTELIRNFFEEVINSSLPFVNSDSTSWLKRSSSARQL
jgi:hypothetical protein